MTTALTKIKIELKLNFYTNCSLMFTKDFCYFCFIDEIGICDLCLPHIETCLNCIVYGNGGQCLNFEIQGDEAVSFGPNVSDVVDWIRRNDSHFNHIVTFLPARNNF